MNSRKFEKSSEKNNSVKNYINFMVNYVTSKTSFRRKLMDRNNCMKSNRINFITMKKIILLISVLVMSLNMGFSKPRYGEKYGDKLNVGFGIGYTSRYSSDPVIHLNYEFDVSRDFTLAPFITFYRYRYSSDTYREYVMPIGVKGAYYFDELFKAGPRWDFYGAGSLGFAIVNRTWYSDVPNRSLYAGTDNLYIDLHFGTRLHLSSVVGLFLDLSTGISTFGLSFSFK